MINLAFLAGRNVAVMGLGKSGLATATALRASSSISPMISTLCALARAAAG